MHFWQYDARTGRGIDHRGAAMRRLPTRVQDDGIWVELGDGVELD
jgi:nitrite reductase/ring-hydroxylating ferredoxin subunit